MESSIHEAVHNAEGSTINASILRVSRLSSSVRQIAPLIDARNEQFETSTKLLAL